jgi:hypothetical protein
MDMNRPVNHTGGGDLPVVNSKGGGSLSRALAIALLIAAIIFIAYFVNRAFNAATADSVVKPKQFQAVFLTNGQVYFGKLSKIDSSYVKLTNIYYLQVQQTVQPSSNSSSNANNQQVSLAKLGGELHGPEDVMYISRSQVLFWENLKTDGKVAKAISDYVSAGNK